MEGRGRLRKDETRLVKGRVSGSHRKFKGQVYGGGEEVGREGCGRSTRRDVVE